MQKFDPSIVHYIWDARNSRLNIRHGLLAGLVAYSGPDSRPDRDERGRDEPGGARPTNWSGLSFYGIKTVFDVFANLFYWMDGQNVVEYESIYRLSSDFVLKRNDIRQRVEVLWKAYLKEQELDSSGHWKGPHPAFSPALRSALEKSFDRESMRSADDVLITMMTWLKVLDRYFDNFYIYKHRNTYIPVQDWGRNDFLPLPEEAAPEEAGRRDEYRLPDTVRGPLIFIHHNPIRETLHLQKVNDPDYTDIRKHARHVWLLTPNERRYEVRHRSLYRQDGGRPSNRIRIGFLAGEMDFAAITSDLDDCFEQANENPTRLFFFTGLDSGPGESYCRQVLEDFQGLLASGCDAVVRPELSSPPGLQELMRHHLEEHPAPGVKLVMTGSFHMPGEEGPEGGIYNSALLLTGDGQVLGRVYKASRFIVHQTSLPTLEGYEFLKDRPAEERIAIDRHELTIYETNFGRVAVFICIDFLTDEVEKILIERAVDLVFIMSMTDNPAGGKFLARMRHLGEKAGTIVCNCNQSFPVLQDQTLGPNVVVNLPVTTSSGAVQPPFEMSTPVVVIDITSRFRPQGAAGSGSLSRDFRDSRELSISIPLDAFRGRENMILALQKV